MDQDDRSSQRRTPPRRWRAPEYFEFQISAMSANPQLGMTSGKTWQPYGNRLVLDAMPDDHVRGPAKFYRRACFEAIGGLQKVLGWP